MFSITEDSITKRLIFVTGKGGVGKTSFAWGLAQSLASQGRSVAVINWGIRENQDTHDNPQITKITLDAAECFHEYIMRYLKFEKIFETVFDNPVLKTFVRVAPGLSDTMIAGKIWDLFESRQYDHCIVDLPASGHALSFFRSPLSVNRLFPTGLVHRELGKICNMFFHPEVRIDLITLPEELPCQETQELYHAIKALGDFRFGFLVANFCLPDFGIEPEAMNSLKADQRSFVSGYLEKLNRQRDILETLNHLPLRLVSLPRNTALDWKTSVHEIAKGLSS